MKHFITLLCLALGLCAFCATDVVRLSKTDVYSVPFPCQVKSVELVDTDADATHAAKKETLIFTVTDAVTDFSVTNLTYTLVYTNGTGTVLTNVTAFDQAPFLPDAEIVQSYVTNTLVTSWSETNAVPTVSAAVTNDVEANSYLAPGDKVFFPAADTFTGFVRLYLEK